jgi:hypothetical protein
VSKFRYVLLLWDRESNGQITATFKELESVDQAAEGVARQMKVWQENHPKKSSEVDIDEVVRKHLELKV